MPVLAADTSSLPEIAGDAALLVDPLDTAAMTAALQRLVQDQTLRSRLIGRGFENARRFTWRKRPCAPWIYWKTARVLDPFQLNNSGFAATQANKSRMPSSGETAGCQPNKRPALRISATKTRWSPGRQSW